MATLTAVWGSGPADVYAVASAWMTPVFIHSTDGIHFEPVTGVTAAKQYVAIGGSGPTDVYVGGDFGVARSTDHGVTWTTTASPGGAVLSIFAVDANDVLVSGDFGVAKTVDHGATWTSLGIASGPSFHSLWAANQTDIWVIGSVDQGAPSDRFFHTSDGGATWLRDCALDPGFSETSYQSLFGFVGGPTLLAGATEVSNTSYLATLGTQSTTQDGAACNDSTRALSDDETLNAVWGSSATDIWAAGQAYVHSTDGTTWSAADGAPSFTTYGIWGSGPHDVFFVGEAGQIAHYTK